jgi:HSP20 family protein
MALTDEDKFFEELAGIGSSDSPAPEAPAPKPTRNNGGRSAGAKKAAVLAAEPKTLEPEEEREADVSDEPEGQLTIDVYQTQNDIVIESAIAGVRPDDLDISVSSDSVTIRGQRHHEKQVEDEDYFYQECYWGRFSRSVILPQEIDPDNSSVQFKNGILTVRLPKISKKKTKKLKVVVE